MATPIVPARIAADIAAAFVRQYADRIAEHVAGPLGWLRAPLVRLVLAIADAVDQIGEE